MIVVLGLYRGGSSAVAGVLHHLGVCMGHEIKRIPAHAKETAPYVCWEDWGIRHACRRCYHEPTLKPKVGFEARVHYLKMWLSGRRADHFNMRSLPDGRGRPDTMVIPYDGLCGNRYGVKYPMLCAMGEEAEAAWGLDVKWVKVERDPDVAAESLHRWYGSRAQPLTDALHERREAFLSERPHVTVNYNRLCSEPIQSVERLADDLGLNPSNDQLETAAVSVERPGKVVP